MSMDSYAYLVKIRKFFPCSSPLIQRQKHDHQYISSAIHDWVCYLPNYLNNTIEKHMIITVSKHSVQVLHARLRNELSKISGINQFVTRPGNYC